ncbi:MAG: hypothetical protein H7338_01490 [Candidatus Sericytochromatia bacterium]|nr:hypothetical protein [Candidatus Sericytochromatia bacterium]
MAIPDHVQRNLASIQADLARGWQTTVSGQSMDDKHFDGFLNAAVTRARDLAAPMGAIPAAGFIPLNNSTGMAGPSAGFQSFMASLATPPPPILLPGAPAIPPQSGGERAETLPLIPGFQSYKSHQPQGAAPTAIHDAAFYDAQAMTPQQIDKFLQEKHSPFAEQRFENGKTAGQLIWETCQKTGDPKEGGPHALNPAMLMGIMGAETSFGKDGHWSKTNPFSIRQNGSFDNVTEFSSSLKIAANTMYNWAQDRPKTSDESLFDYAGRHYCEDYQVEWKPNVEKFYRQALGFGGETQA